MYGFIQERLDSIIKAGNFRFIPEQTEGLVDFSSNDYLGIAADRSLYHSFIEEGAERFAPTSSASRLLASGQRVYSSLEKTLENAYGNRFKALLFNSGYHANVGAISALGKDVIILADKLVHASIIDGMKLGGGIFARFGHNDVDALERLIVKYRPTGKPMMIVVESVYSMDGDEAPLDEIVALKKNYGNLMIYVDEAHAVGVCGPQGLGLAYDRNVDIVVGTFGKALAGQGAFILCDSQIRDYLVNTARSFIFSTALPPLIVAWNEFAFRHSLEMSTAREHLRNLSRRMQQLLGSPHAGHIQPLIVGDATETVKLAHNLRHLGFSGVAIRNPTVPLGTERIRFSLSAALTSEDIRLLGNALESLNAI